MKKALVFFLTALASWSSLACSSQRPDKTAQGQHEAVALPSTTGAAAKAEEALNRFLWNFEGGGFEEFDGGFGADKTRYLHTFVDLNGDGKDEAVVYYLGSQKCGSGGCSLLILTPTGESYDEVGYAKLAQFPIRVLDRAAHGWRSLSFSLCGHGIPCPHEQELKFNGEVYEQIESTDKVKEPSPGKPLIVDYQSSKERVVTRPADTTTPPISAPSAIALKQALQDFLRGSYFVIVHLEDGNPSDFGYFSVFEDLNGDGMEEAVVYLTGRRTIIFTPKGASYTVVGSQSLNPPLRVPSTNSPNGWRQLSGWAPIGGGDMTLRETRLSFDGKRYVEDGKGNASAGPGPDSSGETIMERVEPKQAAPLFPRR